MPGRSATGKADRHPHSSPVLGSDVSVEATADIAPPRRRVILIADSHGAPAAGVGRRAGVAADRTPRRRQSPRAESSASAPASLAGRARRRRAAPAVDAIFGSASIAFDAAARAIVAEAAGTAPRAVALTLAGLPPGRLVSPGARRRSTARRPRPSGWRPASSPLLPAASPRPGRPARSRSPRRRRFCSSTWRRRAWRPCRARRRAGAGPPQPGLRASPPRSRRASSTRAEPALSPLSASRSTRDRVPPLVPPSLHADRARGRRRLTVLTALYSRRSSRRSASGAAGPADGRGQPFPGAAAGPLSSPTAASSTPISPPARSASP